MTTFIRAPGATIEVAKQATITHGFSEECGLWIVMFTINGTAYCMEPDDAANLGTQLRIAADNADRESDGGVS